MNTQISRAVLGSIEEYLSQARSTNGLLNAYHCAEAVCLAHPQENLTKDTIIEIIVLRAGSDVALEFRNDLPVRAASANQVQFLQQA